VSFRDIPRTVWAIALGGALLDASIGMILAIWPVHLTENLGASAFTVGLIEGVGDAITAAMTLLGGYLADRFARRRRIILIGEGIGALMRFGYALGASSLALLAAVRFADRFGRSAIGAPRNALVGEVQAGAPGGGAVGYGALYGVIAIGAGIGPLIASAIVAAGGDFAMVAWATVPIGLLGWGCYWFAREARGVEQVAITTTGPLGDWRLMGPIVALGCLMNVAAVGWAFLLLRGRSVGMAEENVALLFALLCLAQGASGLIGGRFAAWIGARNGLMLAGFAMATANALCALAGDASTVVAGVLVWGAAWGLFNAIGTGVMFAAAAPNRRAFAFGLISLIHTLPMFASGPLYGKLIDQVGAPPAFWTGAGFALVLAIVARFTIPSAWR